MAGQRQRCRGDGLWQVGQRGLRFLWHMLVDRLCLVVGELGWVFELWGGWSFKDSELKGCCRGILKMFRLKSELMPVALLVGFQLHI